MNNSEKIERCTHVKRMPRKYGMDNYVVYGRSVLECEDCAFSTYSRPAMLDRRSVKQ